MRRIRNWLDYDFGKRGGLKGKYGQLACVGKPKYEDRKLSVL